MKNRVDLGEKLRLLRVQRKISQETLAEAIFVKNTTISNWEKGSRQIHLKNLEEICRYFQVPLSYFTEVSVPEKQTLSKSTDRKRFIALTITASMVVTSAILILSTRSNLNNEACYGETTCYVINDPSIVSELQSRSITGGLMTNVEMEKLAEFMLSYQEVIPEDYPAAYLRAGWAAHINSNISYQANGESVDGSNVFESFVTFEPDVWWNTFTNLQQLNQEMLQVFQVEAFDAKIVIFKTGTNTFDYEVWTETIDVFKVDLSLERLYLNQTLMSIPASLPSTILNDYFAFLETSRTWVDPNGDLFGFMPQDNGVYFAYQYAYKATETYNYKAHRYYFFDTVEDKTYYLELNTNLSEGGFFSLYELSQDIKDTSRITITSSRVNLNEVVSFQDLEIIFTNPDVYESDVWTTGGADTTAAFFEAHRGRFIYPDIPIDYSDELLNNPFN
jgi:transcriptional regulator with XRE-family HTH domain